MEAKTVLQAGMWMFHWWWWKHANFFLVRLAASVWILFQLCWNSCGSEGMLVPTRVTCSQCSESAVWLWDKAQLQDIKLSQVVALAFGFGLYRGSNLSWTGADWCGSVLKKGAVSACRCPWVDSDSTALGLVDWNHIWLSKALHTTDFSWSCGLLNNWEESFVNQYWLGVPLWWSL